MIFRTMVLVVPLILGSCFDEGCTDIGCFDGLGVSLTPLLEGGTIRVETEGDLSLTCTQQAASTLGNCAGVTFRTNVGRLSAIRFNREHPSNITVRVYQDDVLQRQVSAAGIDYGTQQPNGPDCPPICRAAELMAVAP